MPYVFILERFQGLKVFGRTSESLIIFVYTEPRLELTITLIWVADSEFDILFFRLGRNIAVWPVWRFFLAENNFFEFFQIIKNFLHFPFCI